MKTIRTSRWFQLLRQEAKRVARLRGVAYPSQLDDRDERASHNAVVHAEAERRLGKRLRLGR